MPYPQAFIRTVAQGTAWSGKETWSTGLNLVHNFEEPSDPLVPAQPQDLQPWWDAWAQWFTRTTSRISTVATLEVVKVNVIGIDGRYRNESETFQFEAPAVTRGANSSAAAAPQLSCAISLVTNKRRGPGSKGRFYPPAPVVFAEGDGLITVAEAQGMADSAATLITALNGLHSYDVGVTSAVGTGYSNVVRSVRVGRVIDTIQRRRSALDEEYVTGPQVGNLGTIP